MRQSWLSLVFGGLLLCGLAWAGYLGWHYLAGPDLAEVPALAPGHQEVAWFSPATSGDSWERLVAALRSLEKDWPTVNADLPPLRVSFQDAFQEQTASIPQILLHFEGHEHAKLWIRWYKLSGESDEKQWLDKLLKRGQAPVAIIGGDTSDRALSMAQLLETMRNERKWPSPPFLISSATAYRFDDSKSQDATDLTDAKWPKVTEIYKHKTFRFCFTNDHIARAVMDFVQDNPQVWPEQRSNPATAAALVGQGTNMNCLTILAAAGYVRPVHLSTISWNDDRYSQDLADRFRKVFLEFFYHGDIMAITQHYHWEYINYSVGGFNQPNPREQLAVGYYLDAKRKFTGQAQLLAIPAGTQQARRFLSTLCRRAPGEVHDLVVITGDSTNFNNVYRDGALEWNVLDMPVPLIFFSHRNPIDASAGFKPRPAHFRSGTNAENGFHTTGTQDLLLLRDMIEALLQAGWHSSSWSADPAAVCERLRKCRWSDGRVRGPSAQGQLLFDDEGNRRPHTGEHIVWLKPVHEHGLNLPRALLSVWRIDRDLADNKTWKRVGEPLIVSYDQARGAQMRPGHGGD